MCFKRVMVLAWSSSDGILTGEKSDITIDTFVCEQTMDQYSSNNLMNRYYLIALAPFMNTIIRLHGTWRGLHSVLVIVCTGEFGVVYKARLQWHQDGAAEFVAVKTLKGTFRSLFSDISLISTHSSCSFVHWHQILLLYWILTIVVRSLQSKRCRQSGSGSPQNAHSKSSERDDTNWSVPRHRWWSCSCDAIYGQWKHPPLPQAGEE